MAQCQAHRGPRAPSCQPVQVRLNGGWWASLEGTLKHIWLLGVRGFAYSQWVDVFFRLAILLFSFILFLRDILKWEDLLRTLLLANRSGDIPPPSWAFRLYPISWVYTLYQLLFDTHRRLLVVRGCSVESAEILYAFTRCLTFFKSVKVCLGELTIQLTTWHVA
jgi:hypothetical protein